MSLALTHLDGFSAVDDAEQVTATYVGSTVSTANASSYTMNSVDIGEAVPKIVVVLVTTTGGDSNDIGSLTIDGAAATLAVSADAASGANDAIMGIFYLEVASDTVANLVYTVGSGLASNCAMSVITITNYTQVAPSDTATVTVTTGTSLALNCDTTNNCAAVGAVSCRSGTNRTFTWTGLTENVDANIESGIGTYTIASGSFAVVETPRTITATVNAAPTCAAGCAAVWK